MNTGLRRVASLVLAFALAGGMGAVNAAGNSVLAEKVAFKIDAQPMLDALVKFSEQSGIQVAFATEDAKGIAAPAVAGELTPAAALAALLEGSGLRYELMNEDRIVTIRTTAASVKRSSVEALRKSALKMARVEEDASEGRQNVSSAAESQGRNADKAAEKPDEQASNGSSEVVVVGSRLGGTAVESALPVRVITRADIDRSGAGTIAQVLSLLPEVSITNGGDVPESTRPFALGGVSGSVNGTTVQLRGLPLGSSLVLVNGRRVGNTPAFSGLQSESFFDLTNIPLAMVERIEVLPYGASAVYGGDGLAGVINIVLKRDGQGLEVRLRDSRASGYGETQTSLTWGQGWSRGSFTATASYMKQGALETDERALTRDEDFRRFGGSDRRYAFTGNPGTVYSLAGCPAPPAFCSTPLALRGNLPGLNAPMAGIPAGQDGQGLTPADFAATAGMANLRSTKGSFFSSSEAWSLAIRGQVEIARGLELFGDVLYTRRDVAPYEAALWLSGGQYGFARVPAGNPFNPFGVDVGVDVGYPTTGNFYAYSPEYLQPQLGLRGGWGEWSWEIASSMSKDLTSADILSADGDAVGAALANGDPAAALNVFRGDGGSFGSQALIDSLFGASDAAFSSDLQQASAFMRGPLASLPAGRLQALLGVEWTREELRYRDSYSTEDFINDTDVSRAVYTEMRVPLLAPSGAQPGANAELLSMSVAYRMDQSDRFEETGTSETVGLEFRPVSSLLLRASYNSAFKPLSTYAAFQPEGSGSGYLVNDPAQGGGYFLVEYSSGGGVPPGLKPETSTSRTLGMVWTPQSPVDLNLSVTAWDSRLRDRIPAAGPQFFIDNEDSFPGRVVRDPQTGILMAVFGQPVNIARTDIAGIDFSLAGRLSTRYGVFSPAVAATWTDQFDEQITPNVPVQSWVGVLSTESSGLTIGTSSWAPRWKGTVNLGWMYDDAVSATMIGRYIGAYLDPIAFETGPAAGTYQKLGDFWMVDLNVDLGVGRWLAPQAKWFSDTRLAVGALNLFNRLPDFCNACFSGYDATQYDIRGRFAYAELRLSF
jgi:iron complex outermembrane receptor protein